MVLSFRNIWESKDSQDFGMTKAARDFREERPKRRIKRKSFCSRR